MPNLRNGSKEEFEPGLTRLRVRHSTADVPRSTKHSSRQIPPIAASKMRMVTGIGYSSSSHLEGIYSIQGLCGEYLILPTRWFTDVTK